jgi:hypothetical protein
MRRIFGLIVSLCFTVGIFAPLECSAAIAFRNKTFISNSGTSTGFTATEPTGAAKDDILLMFSVISSSNTVNAPAGWTTAFTQTASNGVTTRLYWIRRGTSAPSYAVTWASANIYYEASVSAWSGVVTSGSPFDVTASNASTTKNPANPDCPSVTTTVANTVVIALGLSWNGWSTTAQPPTGYTIVEGGVNGSHHDIGVAYIAKAAIGAENPSAFTSAQFSVSDVVSESTVALAPAATTRVRHRVIAD